MTDNPDTLFTQIHPSALKRRQTLPKPKVEDAFELLVKSDAPLAFHIRKLIQEATDDLEERQKIAGIVLEVAMVFHDHLALETLNKWFDQTA